MGAKAIILTPDNVSTGENVFFTDRKTNVISMQMRCLYDNVVGNSGAAGTGNRIVSARCLLADGDIIVAAGWGDGIGFYKLNNDGSITFIAGSSTPINSYALYTSLTLDRVRHIAYLDSYANAGIAQVDYSDLVTGGSTLNIVKLTKGTNLIADQLGANFVNGLEVAGDYLYYLPYTPGITSVYRRNLTTGIQETITVYGVQAAGYRGALYYDEPNDRIFYSYIINGEVWVVTNASNPITDPTNPPKAYLIDMSPLGLGDDIYFPCAIVDNVNPNHVWLGSTSGVISKLDISPCLTTTPADPILIEQSTNISDFPTSYDAQSEILAVHPDYGSDFIFAPSRNGRVVGGAWYDQEYNQWVADLQYSSTDERFRSGGILMLGYGPSVLRAESANGTSYWIYGGESSTHGGYLYTMAEDDGPEFPSAGQITWGPFGLDESADISGVYLDPVFDTFFKPAGTSITIEISNNAGANWSTVSGSGSHLFPTSGNSFMIRVSFSAQPNKCPYYMNELPLVFAIYDSSEGGGPSASEYLGKSVYKISGLKRSS